VASVCSRHSIVTIVYDTRRNYLRQSLIAILRYSPHVRRASSKVGNPSSILLPPHFGAAGCRAERSRERVATRIDQRGATGRHAPLSIVRPIKLLPGNVPQRFRDYAVSPEGDRAMPANPPPPVGTRQSRERAASFTLPHLPRPFQSVTLISGDFPYLSLSRLKPRRSLLLATGQLSRFDFARAPCARLALGGAWLA